MTRQPPVIPCPSMLAAGAWETGRRRAVGLDAGTPCLLSADRERCQQLAPCQPFLGYQACTLTLKYEDMFEIRVGSEQPVSRSSHRSCDNRQWWREFLSAAVTFPPPAILLHNNWSIWIFGHIKYYRRDLLTFSCQGWPDLIKRFHIFELNQQNLSFSHLHFLH